MQESGSQVVISVLLIPDRERSFPAEMDTDRAAESQPGRASPPPWTAQGAGVTPWGGMCSSEVEGDEPSLSRAVSTVCAQSCSRENNPKLLSLPC